MTPEQFQKDRTGILMDYRYLLLNWASGPAKPMPKIEDALEALSELDKEYAAAKSPNEWYEFVNLIDALWRNVKLCEGRTESIVTGLDTITAEILRFKARLEEGQE